MFDAPHSLPRRVEIIVMRDEWQGIGRAMDGALVFSTGIVHALVIDT